MGDAACQIGPVVFAFGRCVIYDNVSRFRHAFPFVCARAEYCQTCHYHNDTLEALAAELSQTFDTKARSDLAVQMQQILLDDDAYVFCSHLQMSMVSKAQVTGLTAHPCDFYEITADLDIN